MQVHRLEIDGLIRFNVGPPSGGRWHVGSGFRTAAVDRLVRRFPGRRGVPFIPGSQIRGVLRNRCEQILLALGGPYSDPHDATTTVERAQAPWAFQVFYPLEELPAECVIDRLFGTRYDGERIFISNAFPAAVRFHTAEKSSRQAKPADGEEGTVRHWRTSAVTRTSMDRLLGIVAERKLFTTEVVSSTAPYRFSLRAYHRDNELTVIEDIPAEYSLLVAGIRMIDALGGDKSTGLGWCTVEIVGARYQGKEIGEESLLKPLLETGTDFLDFIREYRGSTRG